MTSNLTCASLVRIRAANLIVSDNVLYGGTAHDPPGRSTVFKLNTDGTGFTTLYNFTALQNKNSEGFYTNSDGAYPSSLILSGNTLYGGCGSGGNGGSGTIFSLSLPITLPQLTLTAVGANVVLTWPTNASDFALQSTTNLGDPASWVTNSPPPVIVTIGGLFAKYLCRSAKQTDGGTI
jgi:hypothetical protein